MYQNGNNRDTIFQGTTADCNKVDEVVELDGTHGFTLVYMAGSEDVVNSCTTAAQAANQMVQLATVLPTASADDCLDEDTFIRAKYGQYCPRSEGESCDPGDYCHRRHFGPLPAQPPAQSSICPTSNLTCPELTTRAAYRLEPTATLSDLESKCTEEPLRIIPFVVDIPHYTASSTALAATRTRRGSQPCQRSNALTAQLAPKSTLVMNQNTLLSFAGWKSVVDTCTNKLLADKLITPATNADGCFGNDNSHSLQHKSPECSVSWSLPCANGDYCHPSYSTPIKATVSCPSSGFCPPQDSKLVSSATVAYQFKATAMGVSSTVNDLPVFCRNNFVVPFILVSVYGSTFLTFYGTTPHLIENCVQESANMITPGPDAASACFDPDVSFQLRLGASTFCPLPYDVQCSEGNYCQNLSQFNAAICDTQLGRCPGSRQSTSMNPPLTYILEEVHTLDRWYGAEFDYPNMWLEYLALAHTLAEGNDPSKFHQCQYISPGFIHKYPTTPVGDVVISVYPTYGKCDVLWYTDLFLKARDSFNAGKPEGSKDSGETRGE